MSSTIDNGPLSSEDYWRSLFHTYEESLNAPPLKFAINGFQQEDGVTVIGGLSGHGKTFMMLSMVRALLEGTPLFGYEPFAVKERADRVIYLVPEAAIGPFWQSGARPLKNLAAFNRQEVGSTLAKSQVLLYGHLLPPVRCFIFASPLSLTGHRLLWFVGEAFGCETLFQQTNRDLFPSRFTPFLADLMHRKKSLRNPLGLFEWGVYG